jgi:ABC-type lipoprotein export system ATPase subunit
MEFLREFNESLAMTVLMVTHEQVLAERYARRMISLGDGKMTEDRINTPRHDARTRSGGSR